MPNKKSESSAILMTGFPGFIGRRLFERLAAANKERHFYLLVEQSWALEALDICRSIEKKLPELKNRWSVVSGDITRSDLGVDSQYIQSIKEHVGHVWHLAAIYDLSVPQAVAYRVNVQGTRNVLRFCEGLPQLQRLNYISTCYVAGDRTGHIFEDELDRGQGFKNHYESTKFWAELAVQEYFSSLPITIFRPAIVVGDSKTGETAKGDGPYNALHLLKQLPGWLPVPTPGSAAAPVNLVPVDFLVEAMAQISAQEKSVGKVFHLADPSPISARDVLALTSQCMNKGPVLGKLPLRLVEWLVRYESVVSLSGIGSDSLAYYNHEARFDVSNTAAALGDSLHCPRIDDYWQVAVDYAQRHPEIFAGHLPGHTKPAAFAN